MRILLTGTGGQVGGELARLLPVLGELIQPTRAELDLSQAHTVQPFLNDCQPDLIVNPAAYTAVDKAEAEPDVARAVNTESPAQIATWAAKRHVPMIHYSTDYVFDGGGVQPFSETTPGAPCNVYGESKFGGDQAVIASGCDYLLFRTSWVYGVRGANFLNTMLRVAESSPSLRVVDDQVGAPTPAHLIAAVTLAAITASRAVENGFKKHTGVYNLAPNGAVSWHGFAEAIMVLREQMTGKPPPMIEAITTAQYPTPASRPANSRLTVDKLQSTFGLQMPDWHTALKTVMQERLGA